MGQRYSEFKSGESEGRELTARIEVRRCVEELAFIHNLILALLLEPQYRRNRDKLLRLLDGTRYPVEGLQTVASQL